MKDEGRRFEEPKSRRVSKSETLRYPFWPSAGDTAACITAAVAVNSAKVLDFRLTPGGASPGRRR